MKHSQESEIEFRKETSNGGYPYSRGLVIYQYGADLEECIAKARKEFNLGSEWKVISFKKADI